MKNFKIKKLMSYSFLKIVLPFFTLFFSAQNCSTWEMNQVGEKEVVIFETINPIEAKNIGIDFKIKKTVLLTFNLKNGSQKEQVVNVLESKNGIDLFFFLPIQQGKYFFWQMENKSGNEINSEKNEKKSNPHLGIEFFEIFQPIEKFQTYLGNTNFRTVIEKFPEFKFEVEKIMSKSSKIKGENPLFEEVQSLYRAKFLLLEELFEGWNIKIFNKGFDSVQNLLIETQWEIDRSNLIRNITEFENDLNFLKNNFSKSGLVALQEIKRKKETEKKEILEKRNLEKMIFEKNKIKFKDNVFRTTEDIDLYYSEYSPEKVGFIKKGKDFKIADYTEGFRFIKISELNHEGKRTGWVQKKILTDNSNIRIPKNP